MVRASEAFAAKTRRTCLYNITLIETIPSIMQHGIVCYDCAQRLHHESVALVEVQVRRDKKRVPNGLRLYQYANLYFDPHNPMLSKIRERNNDIAILAVSASILDVEGCVLSDRNAATNMAKFLTPLAGIQQIDFDKVYATFWLHPDNTYEERNHKHIKCAEALIPDSIPYGYIVGAVVYCEEAKQSLKATGFDKHIIIDPNRFFK